MSVGRLAQNSALRDGADVRHGGRPDIVEDDKYGSFAPAIRSGAILKLGTWTDKVSSYSALSGRISAGVTEAGARGRLFYQIYSTGTASSQLYITPQPLPSCASTP